MYIFIIERLNRNKRLDRETLEMEAKITITPKMNKKNSYFQLFVHPFVFSISTIQPKKTGLYAA